MTRIDAVAYIVNSNGLNVEVRFLKRTNNQIRHMICRVDEEGGRSTKHGLIPVWDIEAAGYRSIPINGILAVKVGDKWEDLDDSTIKTEVKVESVDVGTNAGETRVR